MRLKDYGPLPTWKEESIKLLRAIDVAIEATIEVLDEDWRTETQRLLKFGQSLCKSAISVDELFSSLASTLGELAFLQIGFVPMLLFELFVASRAGAQNKRTATPLDFVSLRMATDPQISPDGRRVAFVVREPQRGNLAAMVARRKVPGLPLGTR